MDDSIANVLMALKPSAVFPTLNKQGGEGDTVCKSI